MKNIDQLITERGVLALAETRSYDPDAFPGSIRWTKNNNAIRALVAFDAEHPEIMAETKAKAEAVRLEAYNAMSDFAKSGG